MIHHVSIPARDPEHVARVLAELVGGYAGPFDFAVPGAWVVYEDDAHGSGIEVFPERTMLHAGAGDEPVTPRSAEPPSAVTFHALLSIKTGRETIERIGAREGWRTRQFWRGPEHVRIFELYEMWVENRVLLELATPEMLAGYLKIANGEGQRRLLARRGAASVRP